MPRYPVEEALLREPNLWMPGKKPVGPVKIDYSDPLANGLLGFYLMNGAGSSVRDLTENYNGTLAGTASRVKPQEIQFTAGRIDLPGSVLDSVYANEAISVICKLYVTSIASDGTIFGAWGSNSYPFLFWVDVGGAGPGFASIVRDDSTLIIRCGENASAVNLNTWQTTVTTYDGNTVTQYVDGVAVDSSSGGNGIFSNELRSPALGSELSGSNARPFVGSMRHAIIYSRALSASEVAAITKDPYQFLIPA